MAALPHLEAGDAGMRALAARLAQEIESVEDRRRELDALMAEMGGERDLLRRLQRLEAMCSVTKAVGWLGPQLQGVLRDLGGAPAARKAMGSGRPVGGRLAELRAGAGQHDAEDLD